MSTNQTRAASIVATTNCYFLTIHKEDYQAYIKRFEKKQKDQVIDFFKNVSFLKGLSNQAIIKMEYSFRLIRTKKAGEVVLREGEPVTHIALVKDGEFEIVKKNLKGIDDRILGFLHKGDMKKKIAQKVMMLPGRATVYQKTHAHMPCFEKTNEDSIFD